MSALTPPIPMPSSVASDTASVYTDPSGLTALKSAPNSPATLHAAAEQVEALFLQMMLKSMREASEAAGVTESNERGMYEDMFDKQVALTLAQHQDLGFARLLERQLGGAAAGTAAPTGLGSASTQRGALPGITRAGATGSSIGVTARPTAVGAPAGASTGAQAAGAQAADAQAAGAPSSRGAAAVSADTALEFVRQVLPPIRQAARALGVNPLGLLAQAALETGWGQRIPGGRDGASSLNLFGVKAGDEWTGPRVVADTVEFSAGVAQPKRTAFRAYGSIEESVADFARLLSSSPRYRGALQAGSSVAGYVAAIAQSGYATDPEYGHKLTRILESGTLRSALGRHAALL